MDNYEAQEHAKVIASKIGGAVFALVMIAVIFSLAAFPAFQWWLMCFMFGFLAYSVSYAYIFAVNTRADEMPQQQKFVQREQTVRQMPLQEAEPPERVEYAVHKPQAAVVNQPSDLWQNRLFKTPGGGMVTIPEDVSVEHLQAIEAAVQRGQLHSGMSPNKLDGLKIVSRNTEEPNAYTVVDFLVETGILKDNGERKTYTWTDSGRRLFGVPSPTPQNAYNNVDFSRVPEVDATRPD